MSQHVWIAFCVTLLGSITFLYRYSFVSEKGKKIAQKVPPSFLALLAPATFTAIVINNLMSNQNLADFHFKVLVLCISSLVAYVTKSIMLTLIFGLTLLYYLQNY
jgi:branched-subunit amino acid transport protein